MKKGILNSNWAWFLTCFATALVGVTVVHAATVRLEAYVSFAIKASNGVPLVDGSIIQIVGSGDGVIDPFPSLGTNLIATGTTGDDEIVGTVTINSSDLGSNGTFFSADFTFDSENISFLYLRAFDSLGPLAGLIDWSFSDILPATNFHFGVLEVDFVGDFRTTNNNNFLVPEPGSGSLLLVFMSLLFGMRYSMRSRKGVAVPLQRNSSLIDDEEKDWL